MVRTEKEWVRMQKEEREGGMRERGRTRGRGNREGGGEWMNEW
jgi:hypothetical protein